MLVLSRKRNQVTYIDVPPSTVTQRIAIVVAEMDREKVRLAFDAPTSVKINRKEVQDEIDARAKAAGVTP
jgi:carbon storage regulator CsrA